MRALVMLAISLSFVASPCVAATDYKCVSDCTSRGYQYNYCTAQCSYETPGLPTSPQPSVTPHGTDYKCLNNCTAKGYMYQYCQQICSY